MARFRVKQFIGELPAIETALNNEIGTNERIVHATWSWEYQDPFLTVMIEDRAIPVTVANPMPVNVTNTTLQVHDPSPVSLNVHLI